MTLARCTRCVAPADADTETPTKENCPRKAGFHCQWDTSAAAAAAAVVDEDNDGDDIGDKKEPTLGVRNSC